MASRGRVILVDDEPDLIGAFAEYLNDRGFEALTAPGGYAYEAMAADRKPDLVVLDLSMPGESGRDLLMRIRRASDIPLIVMTASGELIDRVLCLEAGADDFVQKPVEPRELAARIQGLLNRRGGARRDLVRLEKATVDLNAALVMHDDGGEERLGIGEVMLLQGVPPANPNQASSPARTCSNLAPAQDRDALSIARSIRGSLSLKRKLATEWIQTRRGHGYIYAPASDAGA